MNFGRNRHEHWELALSGACPVIFRRGARRLETLQREASRKSRISPRTSLISPQASLSPSPSYRSLFGGHCSQLVSDRTHFEAFPALSDFEGRALREHSLELFLVFVNTSRISTVLSFESSSFRSEHLKILNSMRPANLTVLLLGAGRLVIGTCFTSRRVQEIIKCVNGLLLEFALLQAHLFQGLRLILFPKCIEVMGTQMFVLQPRESFPII